MRELTQGETVEIIRSLSVGKAIAFDGLSDVMFEGPEEVLNETANKLKDLWSTQWEEHISNEEHFKTRLIPLNKVHPKTPTASQFRPICISSPLVKILEGKLHSKLSTYSMEKLFRGQTGFVPGMGITVNHMRLLKEYKLGHKIIKESMEFLLTSQTLITPYFIPNYTKDSKISSTLMR